MQPALEGAAGDLALAERDRGVAAEVLQGEDLVAVTGDGHGVLADLDRERLVGGHVGQGAGALERHQRTLPATLRASSSSTAAVSFSSSSGSPILRIRSWKKPCSTRRRASSSETPRLRR